MEFLTLGAYNSTEEEFFDKLLVNRIDTFCEVRQRRGVRGATYGFVNSKRLQKKLDELKITYKHVVGLAPSSEIRDLQKKTDAEKRENKSDRGALGEEFKTAYDEEILGGFNFVSFLNHLKKLEQIV